MKWKKKKKTKWNDFDENGNDYCPYTEFIYEHEAHKVPKSPSLK